MIFTACSKNAQNYIDEGMAFIVQENYEEAIIAFTNAIEIEGKNIEAYKGRAQAYIALSQYENAVCDYQMAIEIDPEDKGVYDSIIDAYLKQGDEETAFKYIEKKEEIFGEESISPEQQMIINREKPQEKPVEVTNEDYSNASLSDITNYMEIMSNFYPSGLYNRNMVELDETDIFQPPNANEYYRVKRPYTTLPEAIEYLKRYFSDDVIRRLHDYFSLFRISDGKLYYTFPARGSGSYEYENAILDHVEPDGTYVVKIMYENVGSGMFEPTYHYFKEKDGKFILEDVDFNGTEDEVFTDPCIGLVAVNVEHIRIRTGAGTNYPQIDDYYNEAQLGEIYPVYEVRKSDGYTWYRIWENRWFSNDGSWATYCELD